MAADDANLFAGDHPELELVRRGLRMSTVFGARRRQHFPDGLPWTCTLRYERRRMVIAYYTQPGLQEEPTVAEVLASLLEDVWRFQHVHDFVEFCATFGYERDALRSEWAYVACGDAAARLRHLLRDHYAAKAVPLAGTQRMAHRPNSQQPAVFPSGVKARILRLGQGPK